MAALLAGTRVGDVFRQEIESAVNSVLQSELEAFLGYIKHSVEGYNSGNSRNGDQLNWSFLYTKTNHRLHLHPSFIRAQMYFYLNRII